MIPRQWLYYITQQWPSANRHHYKHCKVIKKTNMQFTKVILLQNDPCWCCDAMTCTTLHYTDINALHCTALNCKEIHCPALNCTVLHFTSYSALDCTALHSTAHHCTALHYTVYLCGLCLQKHDLRSLSCQLLALDTWKPGELAKAIYGCHTTIVQCSVVQ